MHKRHGGRLRKRGNPFNSLFEMLHSSRADPSFSVTFMSFNSLFEMRNCQRRDHGRGGESFNSLFEMQKTAWKMLSRLARRFQFSI